MRLVAELRDMAIATFDVDPLALARHLPEGLKADVYPGRGAGGRAFVSAVSFQAHGVRLRRLPWPRLAYPQVNYRAYVRGPEGRAVWFFRMVVGSRALALSQRLRGLPLDSAAVEVDASWDGPRLRRYTLRQTGSESADMLAVGTPPRPLEGFPSDEEALAVLTHPLVGYARTLRGHRARFVVAHARLEVTPAEARSARYSLFEDLGLVAPAARPHSVLIARRSEFVIESPERG